MPSLQLSSLVCSEPRSFAAVEGFGFCLKPGVGYGRAQRPPQCLRGSPWESAEGAPGRPSGARGPPAGCPSRGVLSTQLSMERAEPLAWRPPGSPGQPAGGSGQEPALRAGLAPPPAAASRAAGLPRPPPGPQQPATSNLWEPNPGREPGRNAEAALSPW